tara:strand:+ start:257 stop:805 length:549 start_codon:yes stop_codon:yes gene_type:complete
MNIIVFFSGTGTNLQSILHNEKKFNYKVISTFTNNPDAYGIDISKNFNVDCKILDHKKFDSREKFDAEIHAYLQTLNPDYVILAGYMRILSNFLVDKWKQKIINIHPSLLPKYPGLNTHERALLSGDKLHGTTIHYVTSDLDAGPIIRQQSIEIEADDTIESLTEKIKKLENKIYPETISNL